MTPRRKLGEILVSEGLIDELQLRSAIGHQKNWGGKLGSALIELGFVKEEDLARVLEAQLKQRCLSDRELTPEPDALKLVSLQEATRLVVLPLRLRGNELTLAMTNPSDLALTDELGFKLGKKVRGMLAVESSIKRAIKKCYGADKYGRDHKVEMKPPDGGKTFEVVHDERKFSDPPPKSPEKNGEPSAELIIKALAFLLIEKGIIKRDELIEKMKLISEKGQG